MVEGIGNDGILSGQKRLEDTAIGVKAGRVEDGVLRVEVVGDCLLELLVDILRAADEADGGHTIAAGIHRAFSGFYKPGAAGKAEVIVGAEIQRLAAVLERNFRPLGRSDVAFVLIQARLANPVEGFLQMLLEFAVHILLIFVSSETNLIIIFTQETRYFHKFARKNRAQSEKYIGNRLDRPDRLRTHDETPAGNPRQHRRRGIYPRRRTQRNSPRERPR